MSGRGRQRWASWSNGRAIAAPGGTARPARRRDGRGGPGSAGPDGEDETEGLEDDDEVNGEHTHDDRHTRSLVAPRAGGPSPRRQRAAAPANRRARPRRSCPLGKVSAVSEEPLGLVDGRVFRIRPARQDDLDRLLWGGEHLRANRQTFLDRQARGEARVLLPTLDDEPIGHLAVDLVRLREEGGVYLSWFEIRHEFRGKGIGSAVVNRAEQIAEEDGRSFSEIAVEKTNGAARRLYERLGYSLVGERLDFWIADLPDGRQVEVVDDCWVLRRFLGARAPSGENPGAAGI